MAERAILAVRYTPVSPPSQLRKAVGGFLRYIHYRDRHPDQEPEPERQVEGLLKYVAHRDRSSGRGRLFGAQGRVSDEERRQLAGFVARAVQSSRPQLQRTSGGQLVDRRRAVYRFVLSPEHAQGLDLQQLTRATVAQLEADAGGPLRWIAAEHRNTAHPHVHIVAAAYRELAPGRYRAVVLNRGRLARMKSALAQDLERQREARPQVPSPPAPARTREAEARPTRAAEVSSGRTATLTRPRVRRHSAGHRPGPGRPPAGRPLPRRSTRLLGRLAARYRREAERQARDQRWSQRESEGWER
jgi:hypothetical protein